MKFDPNIHHRKSIRLKGYAYSSAGAYFVTICVKDRECILHDPIVSGIIMDVWDALPKWFPTIALDEFVVMPNHIHFIVWLQSIGATLAVAHDAVALNVVAHDVVPKTGQGQALPLQIEHGKSLNPNRLT